MLVSVGFLHHEAGVKELLPWINSGELQVSWALRVDTLTAVMLVVVTSVSSLVHLYSIGYMDEAARESASDSDSRRDLRRALKPEFVNRVRIIHFDRLTRSSAERILDLELERIARRYRDVHGLSIELHESAREELIRRGFSPAFGARHLAV